MTQDLQTMTAEEYKLFLKEFKKVSLFAAGGSHASSSALVDRVIMLVFLILYVLALVWEVRNIKEIDAGA